MSSPVTANLPRKPRILVVDDNTVLRTLIGELLGLEGYEVELAANGDGALQLTRQVRWDAVVLDIDLPDMNGVELYARMKQATGRECLPVVFVTGRREPPQLQRLRLTPWVRLLSKPFDCVEFIRAVAHCVRSELPAG